MFDAVSPIASRLRWRTKPQSRRFVTLLRDITFEKLAFMVYGTPQVVLLAFDLNEHFVEVPASVPKPAYATDTQAPNFRCEQWPKPVPPEPYRPMADVDALLAHQVLDIAQRQRKAYVHHYHQADDLW